MSVTNLTWLVLPLGIVGVLAALTVYAAVRQLPTGNETMRAIARQIEVGTSAFFARAYLVLAVAGLLIAGLLWLARDAGTAGAFIVGALGSVLAGYVGLKAATKVNVRVAEATRVSGAVAGLRALLDGSSVVALAVASLGVLGVGLVYYVAVVHGRSYPVPEELLQFARALTGLAFGASVVALVIRAGGGLLRGANERGAELVASIEPRILRGDLRAPATLACNVGNSVDDTAGSAADLFESYVACVVAAIAIGATSALYRENRLEAVALPILAAGAGLLGTLLAIVLLPIWTKRGAAATLRNVTLASAAIFLLLVLGVTFGIGLDIEDPVTGRFYGFGAPFWALLAGIIAAIVSGAIKPRLLGTIGAVLVPMLIVVAAGWAGYALAGLFGVGLAAVGMLGTVGTAVWASAYRGVAGGARVIARMSGFGPETRGTIDDLDEAGSGLELGGPGFAITAAALATLALSAAYATVARVETLDFSSFGVILGLLLGALLPLGVGAFATLGLARAAGVSAREAERQIREMPGLVQGTEDPDTARSVAVSTDAVLRDLALVAVLALLLPVLIGYGLGPAALGALLAGAMVTGLPLAFFLGAAEGGSASQTVDPGWPPQFLVILRAVQVAPYRNASATVVVTLVKLLATLSLLLAPLLARASS